MVYLALLFLAYIEIIDSPEQSRKVLGGGLSLQRTPPHRPVAQLEETIQRPTGAHAFDHLLPPSLRHRRHAVEDEVGRLQAGGEVHSKNAREKAGYLSGVRQFGANQGEIVDSDSKSIKGGGDAQLNPDLIKATPQH